MNDLTEVIRVKGEVVITLIKADGTREEIHKENLVVTEGKKILARLLSNDAGYVGEYIDKIGFGTSATAAAIGQTSLQAQVLTKAATVSFPAANSVKFSATMGALEGGSSTYQEYALLTHGTNKMFNRVVAPPITKSSAYQIQVDWTISFQ